MTTCKSMNIIGLLKEVGLEQIKVYLSQANRGDIEMAIYLSQGMSHKNKFLSLKVNIQIAIITNRR